ncbi:Protein RMD5-like protein A [Sciurus carolinensis]|uniref:Protein RMD5-like protein A n=1 Tax=Sciurus carolinensis TaxID=30640 RepID=A0AA41SR52_SCICA|nr:Protein RMD5-like protein A [Sciurus carolinensis]
MEQCVKVEGELEKVLLKFSGYARLCKRGLEELIDYGGGLKRKILQSHGQDAELSGTLSLVLTQCCRILFKNWPQTTKTSTAVSLGVEKPLTRTSILTLAVWASTATGRRTARGFSMR